MQMGERVVTADEAQEIIRTHRMVVVGRSEGGVSYKGQGPAVLLENLDWPKSLRWTFYPDGLE